MDFEDEEEKEAEKEFVKIWVHTSMVLPNTSKTQEIEERRRAEERKKKMAEDEQKREEEERKREHREKLEKDKQLKLKREEKEREKLQKIQEETNYLSTLTGNLGIAVSDFLSDNTTFEYSLSNIKLESPQFRLLMKALEYNTSIRLLSLCRKGLDDKDGIEVSKMMRKNSTIKVLEMEGNYLGASFLAHFCKSIEGNTTLASLDLEGNNLTNRGDDESGIAALEELLKNNVGLTYLNLANTNLTEKSGAALLRAVKQNKTLIMLDLQRNPNLNYLEAREIQEYLKANKKAYKLEREREYQDRLHLKDNEENEARRLEEIKAEKRKVEEIHLEAERKQVQRETFLMEKLAAEAEEKLRMEKKLEKEFAARKKGMMGMMM